MIQKILQFYRNIWHLSVDQLSPAKAFLIKNFRILALAFKGFIEDKVQLRASALTFYSLLSIVPIFAMGFAMAKGFGYEESLKEQMTNNFASQDTIINQLIEFADNLLNNTNEGYIAGVGAIVLIWSVMKVMGHIERSFNDIWQVKKSRTFFRKFSDYLAMMVIAPILFFGSISYKVKVVYTLKTIGYVNWISPIVNQLITILILCLLFTLVYIIMPNTKVKYKSGIIAGVITGILFSILEYFFIKLQYSLFSEKYNAIYGAFAALPLFLLWMHYSWLIVLFGAEISFAYQNVENYEFETESLSISNYYKRVLSILILHQLVINFEQGNNALTTSKVAEKLNIPLRLIRELMYNMTICGLISDTSTESPKEMAYQPAVDIHKMSIKFVNDKLDKFGNDNIEINDTPLLKKIHDIQSGVVDNFEKSPHNTLLKDL